MNAALDVPRVEFRERSAPPAPPTLAEAAAALGVAQDALGRWNDERERLDAAAAAAAADLAAAEADAGGDLVADPDSIERVAAALGELRTRQDLAGRAVSAARQQVEAGHRVLLEARADELTARAVQLREVAARRQVRTDALLAELRQHEQADYRVSELALVMPLTGRLLHRADWLDGRAADLRRLAVNGSGEQVAAAAATPLEQRLDFEAAGLDADGANVRTAKTRAQEPAAVGGTVDGEGEGR